MHDEDIVEVYAAGDLAEAHFLHNMLADAGIEARVVGDAIATLGYPPGGRATPRLWVRPADEAQARQLIGDWEKVHARPHFDDEPRTAWKCSACGELVEEDFDLCWNCQNPRQPY